ncbi:UDP-glycosyltransferase 76E1-like protein [Drosera capensis]
MENYSNPNPNPLGRRRRVILVLFPYQGHVTPILTLATILNTHHHFPITIAHPRFFNNSINPSHHPHFHFLPFGKSTNGGEKPVVVGRIIELVKRFNDEFKDEFRGEIERLMRGEGEEIGCVVYDQYMYVGQSVADELGLMSVGLRTGGAASLLSFGEQAKVNRESVSEFPEEDADDSGLRDVATAIEAMKATFAATRTVIREAVAGALAKSAAIVVNTTESLESHFIKKGQLHFRAPILPIGPFHKITNTTSSNSLLQEESRCISWLDKHPPRSVLYISFGSIVDVSESELLEIAWGLEASKQPFLWVIRPGLITGGRAWDDVLPENLKEMVRERSCIIRWAPQVQVLKHDSVGGFWSHCGWNSTLESVCEGVPMICSPFFGDQSVNTMYVTRVWKIGLELERNEFERGNITECIRKLLVEKDGQEMRDRAALLKAKVMASLKEGSSEKYLDQLADLISSV